MLDLSHTTYAARPHYNTMKITSRLRHIMYLFVLAGSLMHCTTAARAQSPAASAEAGDPTIRAGIAKVVGGEVRVLGAKGMRPLEAGDAVFSGDRLVSGKYGLASVVLRDGTTLVLGNNSQLQIQKFAFNATTADGSMLVELLQGSVRLVTGLISKINPDAVQIKSGTLLVGVRGTDFIVEAEAPFPLALPDFLTF